MFDSELKGMARQEQYKDMIREARDASRVTEARPSSVRSTAKTLLLLPVLLVSMATAFTARGELSAATVNTGTSPEVKAALQDQLAALRAATAQFHRPDVAKAAGYTLVKGLDNCFNNPGVGGMGFHLIKTSSLDLTVKTLEPEAMVYAPGPNGQFQLGAVEYIVPAAAWDAAGHTQPPSVLGQRFHLDPALGVYILHAWIWQDNPLGMFQDWNPKVSCR